MWPWKKCSGGDGRNGPRRPGEQENQSSVCFEALEGRALCSAPVPPPGTVDAGDTYNQGTRKRSLPRTTQSLVVGIDATALPAPADRQHLVAQLTVPGGPLDRHTFRQFFGTTVARFTVNRPSAPPALARRFVARVKAGAGTTWVAPGFFDHPTETYVLGPDSIADALLVVLKSGISPSRFFRPFEPSGSFSGWDTGIATSIVTVPAGPFA